MSACNDDLPCIERGDFKACFVNLGEGICGDYDPEDPEDKNLLRIDVSIRRDLLLSGKGYKMEEKSSEDHSACTSITTRSPKEHLNAVLEYVIESLEKGMNPEQLVDIISWMDDVNAMDLYEKKYRCGGK